MATAPLRSGAPSAVPLPSAPVDVQPALLPPTPSAFPSLPTLAHKIADTHDDSSTTTTPPTEPDTGPAAPAPTAAPAGISYASASKTLLPPSSAPQGLSLPPPAPKPVSRPSKDRLRPSQSGRDSPYARAPAGSSSSPSRKSASSREGRGPANAATATAARRRRKSINGQPVADGVPENTGVHTPAAPGTAPSAEPAIPAVGKERRQSLRKVLPPTASKLSPFAASFEFVPGAASSSSSSSSAPNAAPGPAASASSSSAEEEDQPSRLLSAEDEHRIEQTVGSAGAQGDEFRKPGRTETDAVGAVEANEPPKPGQQSAVASTSTSSSASSSSTSVSSSSSSPPQRPSSTSSAAATETPAEGRIPLGAFLGSAFAHAHVPEATLAPLSPAPTSSPSPPSPPPRREAESPAAPAPAPAEEGDWREKPGWWNEGYDPLRAPQATSASASASVRPDPKPEPKQKQELKPKGEEAEAKIPPAVESAQAHMREPLLRFPAWTPPSASSSAGARARDVAAEREPSPPLADFLDSAFVDGPAAAADSTTETNPPTDGSSLLTEAEQRDIATTVGTAGAQADGFVKPGFTEADARGALDAEGAHPADQSASGYKPSENRHVERGRREEEETTEPAEPAEQSPVHKAAAAEEAPQTNDGQTADVSSSSDLVDTPENPTPTTPGALSAFLSGSFAPLPPLESGWTAFEPLDERRVEALAAVGSLSAGQANALAQDLPTSAEAVLAQPTLDDLLDVDLDEKGQVVPLEKQEEEAKGENGQRTDAETRPAESKRGGWWNNGEEEKEGHRPLLSEAEQRDAAATVRTAGAQADEFSKKSFSQADAQGVDAGSNASPSEASRGGATTPPPPPPPSAPKDEIVTAVEEARSGSQTPLGPYLGQAFSSGGETAGSRQHIDAPASSDGAAPPTSAFTASQTANSAPRDASPSTPAPVARGRTSSSSSSSRSASPSRLQKSADSAPSLTLALASAWHTAPWTRKLWAVLASLAINVGLPFVNGVMLGFGELFAHNFIGARLGWPLSSTSGGAAAGGQRANTATGVGLRAAGPGSRANADVPGHAGVKTAVEAAGEAVREAAE